MHTDLREPLEAAWKRNTPFVFFRLPNTADIHCYWQEDNTLHTTTDFDFDGFLFAPFVAQSNNNYIPNTFNKTYSFQGTTNFDPPLTEFEEKEAARTAFIQLVEKAKITIAEGGLEKVVVSRKITIASEQTPIRAFEGLLKRYSNAMVYFFHHPKIGTWMGASPEHLIAQEEQLTRTMALAATQSYDPQNEVVWDAKEREEQGLVTAQLKADLEKFFPPEAIEVSKTQNHSAGKLVHLCTHFKVHQQTSKLMDLVQCLHPTPAVGGVPKAAALDFLARHETYDREFYTGFMGPKNGNALDWFVNLRCAQWKPEAVLVYVGAGITAASNAEKEWEETQRKAQTLLVVL